MKIKTYLDKLHKSSEFKEFQKSYPGSFIAAGFFIIDLESGKNEHQIDYYVPSNNKMAAFTLDGEINLKMLDMLTNKAPEKLDLNTKVDLDELEGILEEEMKNRGITENVKKIMAIIQNINGDTVWSLNCALSGLDILRANIEDGSKSVLKMEKVSIMDFVKKMPGKRDANTPLTKKDIKQEIKQLDQMEEKITKEKEALEKELGKSKKKIVKNSKK